MSAGIPTEMRQTEIRGSVEHILEPPVLYDERHFRVGAFNGGEKYKS